VDVGGACGDVDELVILFSIIGALEEIRGM
jgi:hypothetical protein